MANNIETKISRAYVKDIADLNGFEYVAKKGQVTIENDEWKIYLVESDEWKNRKLRVYVEGYESVDFDEAYAMATEDSGLRRGVNEAMDKKFDQLNRKVVKNQKAVILEAIESVDVVRNLIGSTKFGFWKTAGCSCGCSSGWIVDAYSKIRKVQDRTGYEFNKNLRSIHIIKK